jgi:hypothetical protein
VEAEPVQQLEAHRDGRAIANFEPGASTAVPSNVAYRLGKIRKLGILRGDWLDCGCADGGYTAHLVELGAESATGVTQTAIGSGWRASEPGRAGACGLWRPRPSRFRLRTTASMGSF